MIWTEYHKYPEGMSLLNFYKLKNLHVCLTGLAKQTKHEFWEESHLIIIWEELTTEMVAFYFFKLDHLIGKETLL